jgi:hypothetical protein
MVCRPAKADHHLVSPGRQSLGAFQFAVLEWFSGLFGRGVVRVGDHQLHPGEAAALPGNRFEQATAAHLCAAAITCRQTQ